MAIIIERTITIKDDKATLDSPLYLYIGDGDITCLFAIKEIKKAATFGSINTTNLITENASYGEVRIYKPDKYLVFTARAEIIDDKLQAVFSYENIDELKEAGVHQLQIHLYDNDSDEKNRYTIPPIEINVLYPVGTETSLIDSAVVGYSLLDMIDEEEPTFDEEGNYNKTTWETGDIITKNKLNKLEDALYQMNNASNEGFITNESLDAALANKADKVHNHTTNNISGLARVATTGSYNDLSNKPSFATAAQLDSKADVNHTHSEYLTSLPSDYVKKSDIPTKTSQLTNDSGFITNATIPTTTSQLINNSGFITAADIPTIPTKVSQLQNDLGYMNGVPSEFITESELLAKGYATTGYVTSAINNAQLSGGGGDGSSIDLSVYATKSELANYATILELPTKVSQLTNDAGYITSIPSAYVTESELSAKGYATTTYVNEVVSNINTGGSGGSTDLSGYVTTTEMNNALASKSNIGHTHNEYALKTDIPSLTEVPTNVSAFTNDAGYITSNSITGIEIVTELPPESEQKQGVLYIVKG